MGEFPHKFSKEESIRGGSSRSLAKKLSSPINRITDRNVLLNTIDAKICESVQDKAALKNLLLLAGSNEGRHLISEMIDVLINLKNSTGADDFERNNIYLQRLMDFKRSIWGDKLQIISQKEIEDKKEYFRRIDAFQRAGVQDDGYRERVDKILNEKLEAD